MTDADGRVPEALYRDVTDSVRRLVDVTIRSGADPATLLAAKAAIDSVTDELSREPLADYSGVRPAADGSQRAWGNVVIGLRNPFAPPLVVHHDADGRVWADVVLGAAYCLGLGIPFLLVAIGFGWVGASVRWVKRHIRAINIAGGVLLIAIGVLMVSGLWGMVVHSIGTGFDVPL